VEQSIAQPLVCDPPAFWGKPDYAPEFFGDVSIPTVSAALCRRLGSLPFWRGGTNFMDEMASIYASASPDAMDVFLGRHNRDEN